MPASWWLLPVAAALSMWLAFQHAYGPVVSVPVAVVVVAGVGGGLLAYGRATVAVEDGAFVAGRARLPLWAVGRVDVVPAVEAQAARGPGADPRAYLLIRGYVGPMVRVGVDDPADRCRTGWSPPAVRSSSRRHSRPPATTRSGPREHGHRGTSASDMNSDPWR